MDKKIEKVAIDIYDEDGELCEAIGGPMSYEDVKAQMLIALHNEGIPVIRKHYKPEAEKTDDEDKQEEDEMPFALQTLKGMIEAWGKKPAKREAMPQLMPMVLEYEFDGIKFHACGNPLDVHTANNALLTRVFEEK